MASIFLPLRAGSQQQNAAAADRRLTRGPSGGVGSRKCVRDDHIVVLLPKRMSSGRRLFAMRSNCCRRGLARLAGHFRRRDHQTRDGQGTERINRPLPQRRRAHARGTARHSQLFALRRVRHCADLEDPAQRRLHHRPHRPPVPKMRNDTDRRVFRQNAAAETMRGKRSLTEVQMIFMHGRLLPFSRCAIIDSLNIA